MHNIFKSARIVAFRHSYNLTNFLVQAKLRNPSQNHPIQRLFSMRQSLLYVHLHIERICSLHIPLHRRNKTDYSPQL